MTTTIEWTDETWNPTRGCQLVSPGCHNCYAMKQGHRFSNKGGPYEGLTRLRRKGGPVWTGKGLFVPDALDTPLHWREPRRVFVNSMSDLFFEKFSNEEIAAVFGVMAASPRHTFQVLTKRPKRMREWFDWMREFAEDNYDEHGHEAESCVDFLALDYCDDEDRYGHVFAKATKVWPLPNVWLGVSVEQQRYADERIPELLRTSAAVRFVSYEPALGPVDFTRVWHTVAEDGPKAHGLHWVIVGGESGPGARSFDVAWARSAVEQCKRAGVACFVKQLGRQAFDETACARCQRPRESSDHHGLDATHAFVECYEAGVPVPRLLLEDRKGGTMSEWPEDLRVREWPST